MPKSKLTITFIVCNPDLSGGDRVIAEQAKLMNQLGHKVQVIGVDTIPFSIKTYARSLIKHQRLPSPHIQTDHFDRADIDLKIVKNPNGVSINDLPDADIIIATWWETAEWIKNAPPAKGTKVYFIQGYEPEFPSTKKPERVAKTYELPFSQIVVCEWLREKMETNNPSSIFPRYLVENGIDTKLFHAEKRTRNEVPTIGFVYSSFSVKNPKLMRESIEILRQRNADLKILCFGSHKPNHEHPLPDGSEFHFRPSQEKIREIYASCDAWLFTSDHEGFGLPLLEAMACRTPVIATPAGVSPQIVNDKTGRLCTKRDAENFANHVQQVLDLPPEKWREMSDHAYQMAQKYSWDQASAKFEAALYAAQDAQSS